MTWEFRIGVTFKRVRLAWGCRIESFRNHFKESKNSLTLCLSFPLSLCASFFVSLSLSLCLPITHTHTHTQKYRENKTVHARYCASLFNQKFVETWRNFKFKLSLGFQLHLSFKAAELRIRGLKMLGSGYIPNIRNRKTESKIKIALKSSTIF